MDVCVKRWGNARLKNYYSLHYLIIATSINMFRYFPPQHNLHPHSKRDYWIAAFTFFCVAICLITDADATIEKQNALGVVVGCF